MPPVISKLSGKTLRSQSREIVANVYDFMKEEVKNKQGFSPAYYKEIQKVQERIIRVTDVSVTSVSRILRHRENKSDCKSMN